MYHRRVTFNPYAPPDENNQSAEAGPGVIAGAPQPWDIEEVLRLAWDRVKADWTVLVFAPLLAGGLGQFLGMSSSTIAQRMGYPPVSYQAVGVSMGIGFLSMFVTTYFYGGLMRMMVRAARGQTTSFGELFSGGAAYPRLIAVNLILYVVMLSGMLLLIIPGIILMLGFWMAPYYVVDADMGPIEAMSASWEAARGHKGHFFLFGLVSTALMLVSMCTCVGFFLLQSVMWVSAAILYTRLSGRMAGSMDPPSPYGSGGAAGGYGAGPMPPPGGGWGAA